MGFYGIMVVGYVKS